MTIQRDFTTTPEAGHRETMPWAPAFRIVEMPCIEALTHAGTSDVRAGLDCDEAAVVTCPQEIVRATGHTPRRGGSQDPSRLLTHI
jgi:hypothetical protein